MSAKIDTPDPGVAPGMARLKGRILELQTTQKPPCLSLEVSSVVRAGPSTPVLAEGKVLEISIPSFLSEATSALEADKKIVCLIKYQQVSIADSNYPDWNLREISPL